MTLYLPYLSDLTGTYLLFYFNFNFISLFLIIILLHSFMSSIGYPQTKIRLRYHSSIPVLCIDFGSFRSPLYTDIENNLGDLDTQYSHRSCAVQERIRQYLYSSSDWSSHADILNDNHNYMNLQYFHKFHYRHKDQSNTHQHPCKTLLHSSQIHLYIDIQMNQKNSRTRYCHHIHGYH